MQPPCSSGRQHTDGPNKNDLKARLGKEDEDEVLAAIAQ